LYAQWHDAMMFSDAYLRYLFITSQKLRE